MPNIFVSGFSRNMKPFMGLAFMSLFAYSALVMSCGEKKEEEKGNKGGGPKGLAAEAFVVKPVALSSTYQSNGNLLANESISVYPEVAGRITAIHFKEGGIVHKGDLLVSLNSMDIDAQIQKLKAQRKLQVTTKERQEQLLEISGISKQEYDATITQIASIDADIAYSQAQLRKLEIRATFDGIIGLRNVSVGAIVAPTTLITTIQQVNPLKMDFLVPEQYREIVKQNDIVHFTVAGNSDTMQGKIMAIQPEADVATHSITMRALVANNNGRLLPGTFTNVFIMLDRKGEAITIPSQCIIPTTRDKQVALVRNGKVNMVTVQTGERLEAKVEILQGLQTGDTILTTGIMQVKQGMPVKVKKVTE